MVGVEAPVVGWLLTKLGSMKAWFEGRLRADHAPIAGRRGRPDHPYYGYFLFVAVAPSQSPKPLRLVEFLDRTHGLVHHAFPAVFPEVPNHAGHELIRYRSPVEGTAEEHIITIYPSGLIELQWLISVPPTTSLSLSSIIEPLKTLHQVVRAGGLADLYQPCRFEDRRRIDWRIGINGFATPREGGNSISWTEVIASVSLPERRNPDARPYCPVDGYAPDQLTGLRCGIDFEDLLKPALEEHLVVGGYGDGEAIRERIAELSGTFRELDECADRDAFIELKVIVCLYVDHS